MKKIILTMFLAFISMPAMAMGGTETSNDNTLKVVESKYICMVNNSVFDTEQIAVEVEGKTYYGCCSMCKARLEKDEAMRTAIDPVTGNSVDKALAIIAVDESSNVYYFENEKTMENYIPNVTSKEMNVEDGGMNPNGKTHTMHESM
tara:strand:- start:102 stop:542 length:441 start_codon:yes stop_codon:yes gene_type:complete